MQLPELPQLPHFSAPKTATKIGGVYPKVRTMESKQVRAETSHVAQTVRGGLPEFMFCHMSIPRGPVLYGAKRPPARIATRVKVK